MEGSWLEPGSLLAFNCSEQQGVTVAESDIEDTGSA